MNPIRMLAAKPWIPAAHDTIPAWGRLPMPTAQVGLAVFLAVASVLFSLLVAAYLMRMTLGDWRAVPEPPVLWLDTLLLAAGSIALHRAVVGARRGHVAAARAAFLAGGALAAAFLAGQIVAWRQLDALGIYVASNPAATFFYLLSGLHGLHLLGGIVAWARTAARLWKAPDAVATRLAVGLCATYWHFLLLVWLALFGLLLADGSGLPVLPAFMHAH
jgi:cytochrome c oxidase subunit 3